jgi:hypothetical protein
MDRAKRDHLRADLDDPGHKDRVCADCLGLADETDVHPLLQAQIRCVKQASFAEVHIHIAIRGLNEDVGTDGSSLGVLVVIQNGALQRNISRSVVCGGRAICRSGSVRPLRKNRAWQQRKTKR